MCQAVGLNFKDVLNVLGMYPGNPGLPGTDYAGTVLRSQPGCPFKPGDTVLGFAAGSLGSVVRAPIAAAVAAPTRMAAAEAAATPTVYMTVDAALLMAAQVGWGVEGPLVVDHTGVGSDRTVG